MKTKALNASKMEDVENDTSRPVSETPEKQENGANSDDEESGEAYEVDKILQTRKRGRKREFLVSWIGYTEAENSWEPEDNLGNAREAIDEFMKNQEKETKSKGTKRTKSREKSSTPASSTRRSNYRKDTDESEHDEDQSKDSDGDDEFAPSKKRGRPSKTSAQKSNTKDKKNAKVTTPVASVTPMFGARRMNANLRWLEDGSEDGSDSDESKTGEKDKEQKKRSLDGAKDQEEDNTQKPKEVKAASSTPPSIPDIHHDEAAQGDAKIVFKTPKARVTDEKVDGKKEKSKKIKEDLAEEPEAKVESSPAASRDRRNTLKFVGLKPGKNPGKLVVVTEEKGTRKSISFEDAVAADSVALCHVMHAQMEKMHAQMEKMNACWHID